MKIKQLSSPPLKNNIFLVWDELSRDAFVVDFCQSVNEAISFAKAEKLDLKGVLLTHSHFDHILGFNDCDLGEDMFVYSHKLAADFLISGTVNPPGWNYKGELPVLGENRIKIVSDGDSFEIGSFKVSVVHTPGHSVGSVCFIVNDEAIFTGDFLFRNSFGPTNIPGANEKDLENSKEKIKNLSGDLKVYPGHGRYGFTLAERFS